MTITDRNVYILGAGASANAGAPVIRNFLDHSRQLLDQPSSGLDDDERKHFRRVFDFRRAMAQAREKILLDLDDIEQLFGLVEISHRLGEAIETRNSTVYMIAKTLQMSIEVRRLNRGRFTIPYRKHFRESLFAGPPGLVQENDTFGIDPYDFFAGLVSNRFDDPEKRQHRKDSIITFNYDLVCEHALRRFGLDAHYALEPKIFHDQRDTPEKGWVNVFKLHGSANWGICGECREEGVILSKKVTDSPKEFRSFTCSKCKRQTYLPLLIPPSWDKSGYSEIIAPVWRRAVEELKSATRICIIGYSIPETDAFFKYLITLALAENHQLYKLIVVDYREAVRSHPRSLEVAGWKKDLVKPRYVRLLDPLFRRKRFHYFDQGFYAFLQHWDSRRHLERAEMLDDIDYW